MANGDSSCVPALDAATTAVAATIGEGNIGGGGQEPLGDTHLSDQAPGSVAGAGDMLASGSAAAGDGEHSTAAARVQDPLVAGNGGDGLPPDSQARVPSSEGDAGALVPGLASPSSPASPGRADGARATGRGRAKQLNEELDSILGKRSYGEKRDLVGFLADPTARPANPRVPVLLAEQKRGVRRAARPVESWDERPILAIDQEGQAEDLADERTTKRAGVWCGATGGKWRRAPSSEWTRLVPTMQRRAGQPAVRVVASTKRTLGSAFGACTARSTSTAAVHRASDLRKLSARPGYDGDELTPMLRRLDEQDRDDAAAARRRPAPDAGAMASGFTGATSLSLVRSAVAGTPSRTPKPARAGGCLGVGAARDRRQSVGSALRYRSREFTPRRRPSLAGAGEQRYGAGTLGDWLGETSKQPRPGPAGAAADGRRGRGDGGDADSTGQGQASKRRAVGRQESPLLVEGSQGQENGTPAASNKRAASSLGLDGMDATPRRKTMAIMEERAVGEEGRELVRRVAAEAKATAEVGSILMSVVSQENKGRDVTRQVREEQGLRERETNKKTKLNQRAGSNQPTIGEAGKVSVVSVAHGTGGMDVRFTSRGLPTSETLTLVGHCGCTVFRIQCLVDRLLLRSDRRPCSDVLLIF